MSLTQEECDEHRSDYEWVEKESDSADEWDVESDNNIYYIMEWHSYDEIDASYWLKLAKSLAKMIRENRALTDLSITYPHNQNEVESACILAEALCENSTLKKLEIVDMYFGVCSAEAFGSMLAVNTALREVHISYTASIDRWIRVFETLSHALTSNKTITVLRITPPCWSLSCNDVIATECAKDARLCCISP